MPNTKKQLTAMQKAIKLLDGQKEVLYHLDKDGVLLPNEKIHKTNQINSIQMLLSKLLATERQQLIDFGSKCIENHEKGDLVLIENTVKLTHINTFKPNK